MESVIDAAEDELLKSPAIELLLVWRGQELRLSNHLDRSFTIGLQRDNNLVVSGTYVSRLHATLKWCRNRFELCDHSTNGSFVQLEDEEIRYVHRSSIRLWGEGFLSFGEPLTETNVIRFSHA